MFCISGMWKAHAAAPGEQGHPRGLCPDQASCQSSVGASMYTVLVFWSVLQHCVILKQISMCQYVRGSRIFQILLSIYLKIHWPFCKLQCIFVLSWWSESENHWQSSSNHPTPYNRKIKCVECIFKLNISFLPIISFPLIWNNFHLLETKLQTSQLCWLCSPFMNTWCHWYNNSRLPVIMVKYIPVSSVMYRFEFTKLILGVAVFLSVLQDISCVWLPGYILCLITRIYPVSDYQDRSCVWLPGYILCLITRIYPVSDYQDRSCVWLPGYILCLITRIYPVSDYQDISCVWLPGIAVLI